MSLSQKDLLIEFYSKNPNRDISHAEIVDWASEEWERRTGKKFRDPDRAIRKLYQEGFLIKVKKGVYRYDPDHAYSLRQEDFSSAQKTEIFERDGYRCVICGQGKKDGLELHADHIKPKELGGKAIIENGQTLCSRHNIMKKDLKQTETGKRMFIRLLKLSRKEKDESLELFCTEVLETYEKHNINSHIKWKGE